MPHSIIARVFRTARLGRSSQPPARFPPLKWRGSIAAPSGQQQKGVRMNKPPYRSRPADDADPNPQAKGGKPAHDIRIGSIKAAIWINSTTAGPRHNVTFSRIYKSGEEWRRTDGFGRDDLLVLAKVADMVHTWICENPLPREE
jgi:hypothetical protein